MKESKRGRKRKGTFGGQAASDTHSDGKEDQENMETANNSIENIEATVHEIELRTGDRGERNASGRVLINVTNWQRERSPFGDMFVSPNGQMLSKEYAWD